MCKDSVQSKRKTRKNSHCSKGSPNYMRLCHLTLLFCRGWQGNVQRFNCTGGTIVLLIKPLLVWRRSRCCCRRGLLKLSIAKGKRDTSIDFISPPWQYERAIVKTYMQLRCKDSGKTKYSRLNYLAFYSIHYFRIKKKLVLREKRVNT